MKGIENFSYVIPADLNSVPKTLPIPTYATIPLYCMLLPPEVRLIYIGANEDLDLPPFLSIDESVTPHQLVIHSTDPASAGTYDFVFFAKEPKTGLTDVTVKFQIAVICQVKNFAPVYTSDTVIELDYLIRGGEKTFKLPQYSWTPEICSKVVTPTLVNESSSNGSYPPFFRANMDTRTVTLIGSKEHFEFADQEFRFRLFAEFTDGS